MWLKESLVVSGGNLKKLEAVFNTEPLAVGWLKSESHCECDGKCVFNPTEDRECFNYWYVRSDEPRMRELYKEIIGAGHQDWLEKYWYENLRDSIWYGYNEQPQVVFHWEMLKDVEV